MKQHGFPTDQLKGMLKAKLVDLVYGYRIQAIKEEQASKRKQHESKSSAGGQGSGRPPGAGIPLASAKPEQPREARMASGAGIKNTMRHGQRDLDPPIAAGPR